MAPPATESAGASPAAEKPPPVQTLASSPTLEAPPVEVYERVGRGALTCWFGADGPLKKSHIFNADAPSPSAGGNVEIAIHERDPTQPSPRGARAFQISLAAESGHTRLSLRNNKLPADLAAAMERDVLAWAALRQSCEAQIVRPPAPPPAAEPVPAKKKKKKA